MLNAETKLWQHQQRGKDRMLDKPATYLAWEMGTGKSLAVVAAIDEAQWPLNLIVCPKSVVPVWPGQFAKHLADPDSIVVSAPVKGTVERRLEDSRGDMRRARTEGKPFVLVVNTDAVWRKPMGEALKRPVWSSVTIDEAHRSSSGPRTKFYRWAQKLQAERRSCLSGTPLAHSPLNAWPQFRFLAPDAVHRTYTQFRATYAVMGGHRVNGRPVQVMGYQNLDDLEQRIAPYVDRVRKDDVLDLPPVVHEDHVVELPRDAMKNYRELEGELITEVDGGICTASNVLAKSMRLRQLVQGHAKLESGAVVNVHAAKRDALSEIIADLPPDEPVVVFCCFHRDLDTVNSVAGAAGRPCDELSGRCDDVRGTWQPQPGAGSLAAVQIQSGGVGIDLTAACHVVFLGHDWSLSNYDQAIARLDRPGQTRSVTVHHVIASGTIDETIRQALAKRRDLVEAVMERISKINTKEHTT